VRVEDDCRRLILAAEERFGRVDVLVNNAGFAIFDPVAVAHTAELEDMMQTNYFGTLYCTKAALPGMLARHNGAIVNVASIAGEMGFAGMGGYCATKFAMIGLTEALRNEVISRGIKVSLVCPGTTETEFFETAYRQKMPGASRLMLSISAEKVAKTIIRAARGGNPRRIVPLPAALFIRFKELMPRTAHMLMRRVSNMVEGLSR
jgi:short-subunit dehydrogenase